MNVVSKQWFMGLALAVTIVLPSFAQEAHVGNLSGHAGNGKKLYRRFCVGCHGPLGDGNGENAQWIDPKPRDFVAGTFKCRSTPTGTLPTDEDPSDVGNPPWDRATTIDRELAHHRATLARSTSTLAFTWEGKLSDTQGAPPTNPERAGGTAT